MFCFVFLSLASAAVFCGADGCPQFIGVSHSAPRRDKHCAVVKLRSTLQRRHALPLNLMAVSRRLENFDIRHSTFDIRHSIFDIHNSQISIANITES
ncbi:MAG: hypothetical protein GY862_18320 [Gammaproteobacteria bacterium]|nr:hypothetical protein [Gammaproteobacteria bacterium]